MTSHIYLPVIVLLVGGAGFAVGPLALAWLWAKKFSPQKSGPSKNSIYECGLESDGDAWIKFKPGYYIYAIVFLIFDVEAVFLLAVRGCVWWFHRRRSDRDAGVRDVAGGGPGLGLPEECAVLELAAAAE